MSNAKMFVLVFFGLLLFAAGFFAFSGMPRGETCPEIQAQEASQEMSEIKLDEIKRQIAKIKTPKDLLEMGCLLDEIDGKDGISKGFLQIERVVVEKVSKLVEIGNYVQMKEFTENCDFISTNNLLVMAFFEKGKLTSSKKDIAFGLELAFFGFFWDDFSRFEEIQEFFLGKIWAAADEFSAAELLDIFSTISLEKERAGEFLDKYIPSRR